MEPTACDGCLRRSHLIGHLSPRIAGLLDRRTLRPPGLLELDEKALIAAVARPREAEAWRFLEGFDAPRSRAALAGAGLEVVCRHHDAYPGGLLDLDDPPAALYASGGIARLGALVDPPVATLVGARRASGYGLEVARVLGHRLAAAGVTVVSGLALGVDAAAHRGALEVGDQLIAVLAGGVDVPYPRSNRPLYRRIREGAVIVSELPPGSRPLRWSFPARNRIMAALARITVIVEAADPSGSLITAAYASDLGRLVGAVPGRVTARAAAGSNRLLRDGARVILSAEDVLDELYGVGRAPSPSRGPVALDPPLRRVLDGVEAGNAVEVICQEAGIGSGEVRAALGRLELMGLIARDGLGSYSRRAEL